MAFRWLLFLTALVVKSGSDLTGAFTVSDLSTWIQDSADDTDWLLMKSNQSARYYYIDAIQKTGEARLFSPQLNVKDDVCLKLDYYLSGDQNDTLSVGVATGVNFNQRKVVFTRKAAGTLVQWQTDVEIDLRTGNGEKVFIEGVAAGEGGAGYIAVDNVKYAAGTCTAARDERRITCNETSMNVHIPGSDKSKHYYFYNSPCRLMFNGNSHDTTVSLNSCGLRNRTVNDSTIYYAHIIEVSEDDEIFDEEDLPILVECVYNVKGLQTGDISFDAAAPSKNSQHLVGRPPSNVTSVELFQYVTGEFRAPIARNLYPLEIKLGSSMFFQVKAIGDTASVQVGVRSCRAFSQDRSKEHYLIRNGCVTNKSLKFLPAESEAEKRFTVKSFSLLGSEGPVLMECEAVVCDKGYGPCAPCISGRRKRDAQASELARQVISIGPVFAKA